MRTSKYGASIRRLVDNALGAKKARYECPRCHKLKLVRKSNAVWGCKSCEASFAGGAYSFRTEAGEISMRLIGEYSKL